MCKTSVDLLTFEREMTHISLLDGFDIQSSGKPLQAERTDYTIRFNSVQEMSLSLINLVTKRLLLPTSLVSVLNS